VERNTGAICVSERRFIVFFKDGSTQPITAEYGDQDDEADGYVFFVGTAGGIAGLFAKDVVQSWREDADRD
jgi:hypothetical protein